MRTSNRPAGWRPAALGAAACLLAAPTPVFANGYWHGFVKFWSSFVTRTDGVVLVALIVGVISLFIITRGKWGKSSP
jgi:hypothetical protein